MAKSWGETTGGSNDKVEFLKFNNGAPIGDWGLDALLAVRMSKPW